MNLKDFLSTKGEAGETYWSVVIEPGWIQSGIWQVVGDSAAVLSVSPPTPWEVEDELIISADAALSSAVQKLPQEVPEPSKTVFGVTASWVENGTIKGEYLTKIKKICTELSLTPVGFVILSEAIAHYYKSEEGVPVNAVIVGINNDSLEVSVFKMGSLVGSTQVSRSVSVSDDVVEGLCRFEGASPLPSRFIVFDGKEGETGDFGQSLMNTPWDEIDKVKFLHTPKVEIFKPEKKVLATALAGGSEIAHVTKIVPEQGEDKEVVGADNPEQVKNVSAPQEVSLPGGLDFVLGEDITKGVAVAAEPHAPSLAPAAKQEVVKKTKKFFRNFSFKAPSFKIPFSFDFGKIPFFAGMFFLMALIASGLIYWWFYPTARVVVFVSPKKFEETTSVDVSSLGSSEINTQVSGERTVSTTGRKVVGDRTKGTVEIQNGTAVSIKLAAGTVILSSGELKYTLDDSASVSAKLSPTSPGKAPVQVTASSIGAEYNLAKDETFRVGNYLKADVVALATSDLSGGSSREIQAVDENDQLTLLGDLQQELVDKAKGKLLADVAPEQFFVDGSVSTEADNKNFNHKVGDETESLKLSLDLTVKALLVNKAKLVDFAKQVFKDKTPSGYVLRDSQLTFSFKPKPGLPEEKNLMFDLVVGANFLPQVNSVEISKKIVGKLPDMAKKYLTSVAGFSRAEISISPNLPGRLGTLPKIAKHISIEISAEK